MPPTTHRQPIIATTKQTDALPPQILKAVKFSNACTNCTIVRKYGFLFDKQKYPIYKAGMMIAVGIIYWMTQIVWTHDSLFSYYFSHQREDILRGNLNIAGI